jgi:hypothetical protein
VTSPTPHERVDIDTIALLQVEDVLPDALDRAGHVQSEDARQIRDRQLCLAGDEIVRVWDETTGLDLDQDVGRARSRLGDLAEFEGFVQLDEAGDIDFGHGRNLFTRSDDRLNGSVIYPNEQLNPLTSYIPSSNPLLIDVGQPGNSSMTFVINTRPSSARAVTSANVGGSKFSHRGHR